MTPVTLCIVWLFGLLSAHAGPGTPFGVKHPICAADYSEFHLPINRWHLPKDYAGRSVRPGLLYVQAELCRCLPRRRRHQPAEVFAQMHIQPNAGQVRVTYRIDPQDSARLQRMLQCLGEPSISVEPTPYVTDMVGDGVPIEEVLVYPLKFELASKPPEGAEL